MNALTLKKLYNNYLEAEERSNKADQAWENDPENEELEKAFDEAYAEEHKAFEKIVEEILAFTSGKINHKTAGTMLRTQRAALEGLFERIA